MKSMRKVAKWVEDYAAEYGMKVADEESENVARRAWNEMAVAMNQCGLSSRTINRVIECVLNKVDPEMERIRTDIRKQDSNKEAVLDADCWMKQFLGQREIKYLECERRKKC